MPRGRPKGSKNRTPEEKQATRASVERAMAENDRINGRDPKKLSPEAKEAAARSSNSLVEAMKVEMEKQGIKPLFISSPDKIKASDIIPFPSDWDKMGKVDRLKWLKNKH